MSDVGAVETAVPEVETSEVVDTAEDTETTETEGEQSDQQPKAEEFSAKAKNAIRYRERKLSKALARVRELEALIPEATRKNTAKLESLKAPAENEYTNYGDLVKAQAVHEAKKEIMAAQNASQTEVLTQQHQEAIAQRGAEIAEQEVEFAGVVGDYEQTVSAVADVLGRMPVKIKEMLRDMDNPSAAVYALVKQGRLQDLAIMNPAFAAVTLMQAQESGEGFFNFQKQQAQAKATQAPDPMRGAKGTARSSSLDSLSGGDLLKHYKLK